MNIRQRKLQILREMKRLRYKFNRLSEMEGRSRRGRMTRESTDYQDYSKDYQNYSKEFRIKLMYRDFYKAVKAGDISKVRWFINSGLDVNIPINDKYVDDDIVQLLRDHGANI